MPTIEAWKPHPRFAGLYEICTLGEARSLDRTVRHRIRGGVMATITKRGRVLRQRTDPRPKKRHHSVTLVSRDGKKFQCDVAVLVLETFVGPRPAGYQVCHGPRKRADGSCCDELDNLEWGTAQKNNGPDRLRDGTLPRGSTHGMAKLTEADVREIRRLYALGLSDTHPQHTSTCGHWIKRKLAAKFGVSTAEIKELVTRRRAWLHVSLAA